MLGKKGPQDYAVDQLTGFFFKQYVLTKEMSIQYKHMFGSVFQWLPTLKSCQTLNLNHL